MHAEPALRQRSRILALAAAVPLAIAVADDVRVRRHLQAAHRDPLTGLPGRDALTTRTASLARAHRDLLHVLVADADGLKTVNDTLGHAAGDTLIAAIGHRLGAWAKARGGLAARLGGDEFGLAVLLPPTVTLREVTGLRQLLAQPVDHGRQRLTPAVSIGTARAADLPEAADAARLLRGADMAMYRVKTGEKAARLPGDPPRRLHAHGPRTPPRPTRHASAPRVTRRIPKTPLWEPGCIPAPGALLDWRDARHFDRWQNLPCVLCQQPTPIRPHYGEPVHKVCAQDWITQHPTDARLGRFASAVQPKSQRDDDHA